MSMPPPPKSGSGSEKSLTTEQQSLITETLAQFDVENLTEADAQSIVETFSQAGIQPSSSFEQVLADSGFDAKSIGELAGVSEDGNRPPPPPKQSSEEITSIVEYLTELMEEKLAESNNSKLTDEDRQSILDQVSEKFDLDAGDSIINTTA
ncbi:hypothetical protein KO502_12770 [Colwellia sp. E2M01]|nr:hypothetical protein [Colwellia sp. E2M01]